MGLTDDGQIECYACQSSIDPCPGIPLCLGNNIVCLIVFIIALIYYSYNHYDYFKNNKTTKRTHIFNISVIAFCCIEVIRYLIVSSLTNNSCYSCYLVLNLTSQVSSVLVLFILELRLLNAVEVLRSYKTLQLTTIFWAEILVETKFCLFCSLCIINAIIGNYNVVVSSSIGNYLVIAIVVTFCLISIPLIYVCIAIYRNLRTNENVDDKVLGKVRNYFIRTPIFMICSAIILIIVLTSDQSGTYSSMILEDLINIIVLTICYVCYVSAIKKKPVLE